MLELSREYRRKTRQQPQSQQQDLPVIGLSEMQSNMRQDYRRRLRVRGVESGERSEGELPTIGSSEVRAKVASLHAHRRHPQPPAAPLPRVELVSIPREKPEPRPEPGKPLVILEPWRKPEQEPVRKPTVEAEPPLSFCRRRSRRTRNPLPPSLTPRLTQSSSGLPMPRRLSHSRGLKSADRRRQRRRRPMPNPKIRSRRNLRPI
ncbi:Uncharacterised protein [Chromobacterium violaceum]|uniref:Uncharacterized protein n=1 Tax=Chromobacterium violaceum TaxID=536 RepID=A0A3S4HIR5_CHRVL|nr:Uncharacterised protein [Chromobacterium violaceum]